MKYCSSCFLRFAFDLKDQILLIIKLNQNVTDNAKGGGSIFTFEIKGGANEARAFIDKLEIFSLLANVADVKSLVIHPASTTHSQMDENELQKSGIKPNTIRLSIGTEHIDDLIYDLEQAFKIGGNPVIKI